MSVSHFSFFRPASICGLSAALLVQGCAGPAMEPRSAVELPTSWQLEDNAAQSDAAPALTSDWWRGFGAVGLERLLQEAEQSNSDLRIAYERMRQADYALQSAGAARLPTVSASASTSSRRSDSSGSSTTTTTDATSASLSLSYEVDLWGRLAANQRAGAASFEASRYDWLSARLSLQASVASGYFTWLSLAERVRIARENLATAERVLKIVESRYQNGVATPLDVSQQRTTVLSLRTAVLPLEVQQHQAATALALLLGRVPQGFAPYEGSFNALQVPTVNRGLPSTLLTRRPDLASAEWQLKAADANVAALRAALFPTVTLAGAGSLGTSTLLSLTDPTRTASLSLSLAKTLFDGGRQRLQVRTSESQRVVLIETYASVVRTALKEVDDASTNLLRSERQEVLQSEIVVQAQRTLQLAELRYRAGTGDLLTVLDAQRTLFSAQDTLATQRLSRLTAVLDLYKALGGDWSQLPDVAGAPETASVSK